ncbi:type VII toxin-antitoxin system MntA family adenylyltransferase antitoxin [Candidatus Entotheonella palauensis]|uniref:type VII toxin-antitoxin system MntA family adenylyltransferase antitoxin n=1 Tax=Candidatus Entotheonella palauensis TaxID=93172 RepID=UPI000B80154E|nr:nucleotidyltransferase family protein [Candidatus Entotheonella palauensis]
MEIADLNTDQLIVICRRYDANFLGVFGSFARGEAKPDSDLDLVVRFASRKSLLALVRLERELSEALGRKVDVLTEASISPYLRDHIRAETKVLYDEQP